MNPQPAIEIKNLTIQFDGKKIVNGFSLSLGSNEKVTITGPSGSGKTSLLRCIMGFTVPTEGSVSIEGQQVTAASIWNLRNHLAYVAQEPDIGTGRVWEILNRPFSYRVNTRLKYNLAKAPDLFHRFLLPIELMDKETITLSGGEKQRVALILSILLERKILLLDEASSALDDASKYAISNYFSSQESIAVLSVSHDSQAFSFSDNIITF